MQTNYLVFIIKLTGRCNLNCTYCYEKINPDRSQLDEKKAEIVFRKIRSFLQKRFPGRKNVHLIWHGGEPLLLGHEKLSAIFQMARDIVDPASAALYQSVQTNGLLIDDRFVELFKKHNMNVGLSLDFFTDDRRGPKGGRIDSAVLRKLKLLAKSGVPSGYITVISSKNVDKAEDIYRKMRAIDRPVSILPVMNNISSVGLMPKPYEYGTFLIKIAKLWLKDRRFKHRISPIDGYLSLLAKGPKGGLSCTGLRDCYKKHFHIKCNGDVTNCDNFVGSKYVFGNIYKDSLNKIFKSPKRMALSARPDMIKKVCRGCKWLDLCNGGCPANTVSAQEDYFSRDCYCETFKMFNEAMSDEKILDVYNKSNA